MMESRVVFLSFCLISISSALDVGDTVYFCGKTRGGQLFHIPRTVDCHRVNEDVSIPGTVSLYVPIHPPEETDAFKCHVERHRICTHYNWDGAYSILQDKSYDETVTRHECDDAIVEKKWRGLDITRRGDSNIWATNVEAKAEYWWLHEYCKDTVNFVMEKGRVATLDEKVVISNLAEMGGCPPKLGYCKVSAGVVIWNPALLKPPCPFKLKGKYPALISSKGVVTISSLNGAFTRASVDPEYANRTCLPGEGFFSDQGPYLVFTMTGNDTSDRVKVTDKVLKSWITKKGVMYQDRRKNETRTWASADPENSKLELIAWREESDLESMAWELRKLICQNAQNHLYMLHQKAKDDTTGAMRVFLKTDSIVARFVGDAILVSNCMSLTIRKIYEDHKVGNRCYEWTPVEAAESGKSDVYFLLPGGREIGLKSPKIKCITAHPRVYFDGKIWRTADGPVHVTSIPVSISLNGSVHLTIFNTTPTFETNDAEHTSMAYLHGLVQDVVELRRRSERIINETASFSVDPQAVMNDLLNEGEKVVGYVEKHSVFGFWGKIRAFLDTVVGVAVFALFVFIAYKIFRCYCQAKNPGGAIAAAFGRLRARKDRAQPVRYHVGDEQVQIEEASN